MSLKNAGNGMKPICKAADCMCYYQSVNNISLYYNRLVVFPSIQFCINTPALSKMYFVVPKTSLNIVTRKHM